MPRTRRHRRSFKSIAYRGIANVYKNRGPSGTAYVFIWDEPVRVEAEDAEFFLASPNFYLESEEVDEAEDIPEFPPVEEEPPGPSIGITEIESRRENNEISASAVAPEAEAITEE